MTIMTMERLAADVRWAVAERGEDYVYQPPEFSVACTYAHDGGCSCIFGLILHERYSVPIDLLEQMDLIHGSIRSWLRTDPDLVYNDAQKDLALRRLHQFVLPEGQEVADLAHAVQKAQDQGFRYTDLLKLLPEEGA